MRWYRESGCSSALTVLCGTVRPLGQGKECLADLKMPAVGQWAEYQGVMSKKDPYTMRYAVVGSEERDGKP